jgi:integrase
LESHLIYKNSSFNKPIKPFLSRDRQRIFHIYYSNSLTGKRTKKSTKTAVRTKAENELDKFIRSLGAATITQTLPKDLRLKDLELLLFTTNSNVKSPKSHELNKLAFKHLITILGDKYIHEVTRIDADIFVNTMLEKVAKTSLNIYLRQLKCSFGKATGYDLIPFNPFQNVRQVQVPDKIRPNITEEDLDKLISVMDDEYMIKFTKFAFLTGMRLSEIMNLQWSDIDFEANTIKIQNKLTFETKTRRNREIALTPAIRDTLLISNNIPENKVVPFRNPNHYIFGNRNGFKFSSNYISHKFKRYVRKAGLNSKVCAHSLRHGALSNMAANGTPVHILQEIAGHTDINTTERYLHTNMEQIRKFMEKVDYGF